MVRRLAPIAFAAVAACVAACGHQVTPSVNGASNLAGRMLIRFRTKGVMDFARYDYVIVVNTCATGESDTPLPNVYNSTFSNYSYSFVVGASNGGVSTTFPLLFQYVLVQDATDPLGPQPVPLDPSQTNLEFDSDGANDEFQLIFVRSLLDNPKRVAQPCPNIPIGSASPIPTASSTPTATASATASASPTSSAGASPATTSSAAASVSATPTASPTAVPTTPDIGNVQYTQPVWYFNFFVLDHASRRPLDSLGIGGPMDTSYSAPGIDTRITRPYPIDRSPDQDPPSAPAAQIDGGYIENFV